MSKCNFVNHDLCRGGWVNASLEKMCIAVEQPCPHKALAPAEKVPVVEYVFRLQPVDDPLTHCKTYEIGVIETPRDAQYASMWCDRRVCEGFWGNEEQCRQVVVMLNESARKPAKPDHIADTGKMVAKPAIEPLSIHSSNKATRAKVIELEKRVNALEGGGG